MQFPRASIEGTPWIAARCTATRENPLFIRGVHPIAPKQYRFKLQAVLDYRSDQLAQVQQRVAVEEQKRLHLLQRIQETDAFITQAFQEQQQVLTEPVLDPLRLQGFPNYIWRLKQDRFQIFQALQQQEQKLQAMREELKQAMIKKKSLDILKDKDQARYRKQLDKAEEEFLAEIALNRATRQTQQA